MTYEEVLKEARTCIGDKCFACPICNGKACGTKLPGPGAKGDAAMRNYEAWSKVYLNMDTIYENQPIDTSIELFGKHFAYPFFAGPVGAIQMHYSDKYNDITYNDVLVSACSESGIAAFTGDGVNAQVMEGATKAIHAASGIGIPTIKPWNKEVIEEKVKLVGESGAFAVAMDIDAAGLPFLKNMTPPAGSKTVEELKEIIALTDTPFIIKGVMTVKGALKAKEAGAKAIVVSNHGGRVLEGCAASADVLEEIVDAVGGTMKIFVDGGIRSGGDVFKALAMGADGIIIARTFVTALFGGGAEGVTTYVKKIGGELADAMSMCGATSIKEITRDMIRR